MKLGFANHPRRDILEEIDWIGGQAFDFVDLCLESDRADPETLDIAALRKRLERWRLGCVGHTAYYLPTGSPMAALRRAAVDAATRCLEACARIGAPAMTVHTHWPPGLFSPDEGVAFQVESLGLIVAAGQVRGVDVMLEPIGTERDTPERIQEIIRRVPGLACHLDLGHGNLCGRTPEDFIRAFAGRIRHVHASDNDGIRDLHLPPGVGHIDWETVLGALKATGYDGTITLEVFSRDRDYVRLGRDKIRALWDRL